MLSHMSQEDWMRVDLIKPHFIALCKKIDPQKLVELLLQSWSSLFHFNTSANTL